MLKTNEAYIASLLTDQLLPQLLAGSHSIPKVKNVLELLPLCSPAKRLDLHASLVDLLRNRLCTEELPKYQTQDYVLLRSKFGINSFPYDDVAFVKPSA